MKILQALKKAADYLEKNTNQSPQESKIEAVSIFVKILNIKKSTLYSSYDKDISINDYHKIEKILNIRQNKIPLSYILNSHSFFKEEFFVNKNVLIPRPETESIINEILLQGDEFFKQKKKCIFLDAGSGSGCVGITLANERPKWEIILSDLYIEALEVAKINLKLSNYNNINLLCADWLAPFKQNSLDFIFSNPPYIAIDDKAIERSVVSNEPSTALFSGADGLADIKKIISLSKHALSSSGILFMENGIEQSDAITSLLELNDFTDIRVHLDYNGVGRFTSSRKHSG